MTKIIFCNGRFCPSDEPVLPATDRGLLFGDGLFTTMRVSDGVVEFFDQHLQRLARQCRQLGVVPPPIHGEWVQELIVRNKALEGLWRLKVIVTGGEEPGLSLDEREAGSVLMLLEKHKSPKPPLHLGLSKQAMVRPTAQLKTLAYLDRLSIRQEAQEREVDDLITTLEDGTILEASTSNLFWVSRNALFIPDRKLPLMSGVFLENVLHCAQTLHLHIKEVQCCMDDVPATSHLFACNACNHAVPVTQVGQRKFSRDRRLEDELAENIRTLIERHSLDCSWQTV